MTGNGFVAPVATLSAIGTVPVSGWTNETWEEAQEPEMVLDKETERVAVGH